MPPIVHHGEAIALHTALAAENVGKPLGPPLLEDVREIDPPGGEPDFMMATSKANFDAINNVPIFYGSRANAGHSATYFHPGGGEFANVAVAWLDWQLKGNKKASAMPLSPDWAEFLGGKFADSV